MKVLYLTTRPPWPPFDGGRVLMSATIKSLIARGHEVTVVAPQYDDRTIEAPGGASLVFEHAVPRGLLAVGMARLRGLPVPVARHEQPGVRAAVDRLLDEQRFDLLHVEQALALPQAAPAFDRRVPVVLRAQNVESTLWKGLAIHGHGWMRAVAAIEAPRLARWEALAVARVSATAALTSADATAFGTRAPAGTVVHVVRMPMPSQLPAADAPLPGRPAIVVFGSSWLPNADGVSWFLDAIWPEVARGLPDARLHVFRFRGPSGLPHTTYHEAPADSRTAFAPGSILAVPLRIGSGARVRVLEAWARGVPAVTTAVGAAGLEQSLPSDPPAVLQADCAEGWVQAFRELSDPLRAAETVASGRAILERWHRPDAVADALERVYREAIARES